jgi:hypothetical protein
MQLARLFDFLSLSLFFYFLKKKTEAESNLSQTGFLQQVGKWGGGSGLLLMFSCNIICLLLNGFTPSILSPPCFSLIG